MVGAFDCIDEMRRGPGLTFYNISDDGFDCHSGRETPGWMSACRRRR